jgi:NAD(P)-dependent dehydrogenase (short-subunit alcohol dehydrogenase family)
VQDLAILQLVPQLKCLVNMEKILRDKVAIITGANQGFGLEIAAKYVSSGAHVMLCARSFNLLENAQKKLLSIASPSQNILFEVADVSSQDDVRRVIGETLNQLGDCHILVNNAGIYGPKGEIEKIDYIDWVRTIEINLFGSVLMSQAVLPHFKKNNYGKIIQVGGGGAANPMPRLTAYAASKAAIVRYMESLAEEVREYNIDVNSIAPGALNTKMLDEILEAGPERVGIEFYARSLHQKEVGGAGLTKGVDLALFLASSASDGITAKLISALWDNWQNWPNHLETLAKSDVYSLRRIVGKDRGFNWGDV